MKKFILNITIFIALILSGCQDRERTNIFDPNTSVDSLDISLRITQSDTLIRLQWNKPQGIDFKAFNIYRKKNGETAFALTTTLPPSTNAYQDTVEMSGSGYTYYLTILGSDNESVPTKKIKTIPGPGTYWILDLWAYNIFHYTYDMHHAISSKYAIFTPAAMAISKKDDLAAVTYTHNHYLEIFNTNSSEVIAGFDQIKHPFDCIFDSMNNGFWVTDSSGGLYLYTINNNKLSLKSSATLNPIQILDDHDKLWIVDRKRKALLIFDKEGQFQKSITHIELTSFKDPYYMTIDRKNSKYFFLDHNEQEDKLYSFNSTMTSVSLLHRGKNFKAVRFDSYSNSLWLSVNDSLDARIVQLSPTGLRLRELTGFRFISDFIVNPSDGSLTIADPGKREVTQMRWDGNIIGILTKVYYPFKVYIQ